MCRKMIVFLCCIALAFSILGRTQVWAAETQGFRVSHAGSAYQQPLVPAMFLVLAGFGIWLLFDKKE